MNLVQRTLLLGAFFVMCTAGAFSQLLGEIGYEYGVNGMNKSWITGRPAREGSEAPTVEENYLRIVWVGLGVQMQRFLGSSMDLKAQANFTYADGSTTEKPAGIVVLLPDPINPDTVRMVTQSIGNDYRMRTQALGLDLLGRFPLYGPLGVESGLRLNYRTAATFERRRRLIEPPNARFHDGTREQLLAEGTDLPSSPFTAGVIAGLTYDIPFTAGITLRPGLRLRFETGTIDDGSGWSMYAVGINVGMLFDNPE